MRLRALIALASYGQLIAALVTLATMRNLTALTDDCRWMITGRQGEGKGGVEGMVVVGAAGGGAGGGAEQVLLASGGDGDRDEVEDTVTAALRVLCSDLLKELEKPLDSILEISPSTPKACQTVIKEYHQFIEATVKLLHEVQERQMQWSWSAGSGVMNGIVWMQGLWASRKTNTQERSFVEQQMELYNATGCFGKSKEVLKRDVEIVEYMNDLIDSFQ